ncbi:Cyclin-dependent kinase 2 [Cichlidogyrus casuarinus]|uniref:Cyclin-dependent kinase 2 n=1 Tax=Cichlidogyrus casuarinus TaxID=1844966 RepID=A0ABD2Q644_9PLAT
MEQYKHFKKRRLLGCGTYGKVYIVKDEYCEKGNSLKALKEFTSEKDLGCISPSTIREIAILKELNKIGHLNIVRLEQVLRENDKISVVYEHMKMDLKDLLDKNAKPDRRVGLPLQITKSYALQLFRGLDFLHSHSVMHRDLKPANILVDKTGQLKIADFGMAKSFSIPNRSLSNEVVTLWYRAPEIMLGKSRYDFMIDIWSVGCIVFEMAVGEVLFQGDCEIDQLFQVFQLLGTPDFKNWPNLDEYDNYSPLLPNFPGSEFPFNEVIFQLDQVLQVCSFFLVRVFFLKIALEIDPSKRATAAAILECDILRRATIAPVNRLVF